MLVFAKRRIHPAPPNGVSFDLLLPHSCHSRVGGNPINTLKWKLFLDPRLREDDKKERDMGVVNMMSITPKSSVSSKLQSLGHLRRRVGCYRIQHMVLNYKGL